MVCDFGRVKKHLRQWLDDTLDHKLLVPSLAPQLHTQVNHGLHRVDFTYGEGLSLSTSGPASAFCFIPAERITAQSVAAWCISQLAGAFGDGVTAIELSFSPEATSGPYYQYSHGLKKHGGNCQRIAHGHRSIVKVWRNEQLCLATMEQVATQWRDIYIGTQSDLIADHTSHWEFAYTASQGDFHLRIPKSAVYLMNEDTTVENISAHLAAKLKAATPQDRLIVKAYEGLGKGAEVAC